jgi:hypothetical protein
LISCVNARKAQPDVLFTMSHAFCSEAWKLGFGPWNHPQKFSLTVVKSAVPS